MRGPLDVSMIALCFRATVNHPNVAGTLDYIEDDADRFFLVEEYVDGEDLRRVASRFRRLDPHTAAYVLHHLARGVAASHRVGVVHRDLKPSNIMVAGALSFAGVKVTDFGIAKMAEHEVGEHVGDDDSTAQSSTVMNALAYMAPEVINSPHDVQKAADVWAVAAIVWNLLTGKPPFGSGLQAVTRILEGPVPSLDPAIARHSQFGPLARELAALLLNGMERAVEKRPAAAQLARYCDKLCYLPPARELGTVENYPRSTWGFIRTAVGDEVFFHVRSVVGTRPEPGTPVWFTRFDGAPNPRAIPVVPLIS